MIFGEACAMNILYELLYFHHSYKAEFALVPQSKRTIGTGCGHTAGAAGSAVELAITAQGLQGICTFDEFVRHVLRGMDLDRYTTDSHGNTMDPDSKVSANFGQTNDRAMGYSFKHIFPEVDVHDRAESLVIKGVADAVQKARMATEAGPAVLSRVALMLPKIAGYISITSQYRISGQTEPKLKSLEVKSGADDRWVRYVALSEHKILDLDGKTEIASYSDLTRLGEANRIPLGNAPKQGYFLAIPKLSPGSLTTSTIEQLYTTAIQNSHCHLQVVDYNT